MGRMVIDTYLAAPFCQIIHMHCVADLSIFFHHDHALIRLGEVGDSIESKEISFQVKLTDKSRRPQTPQTGSSYNWPTIITKEKVSAEEEN